MRYYKENPLVVEDSFNVSFANTTINTTTNVVMKGTASSSSNINRVNPDVSAQVMHGLNTNS
jgi:hypothetical protein